MVFTGVTAFLLALFYMFVYVKEGLQRTFKGMTEIIVNALWTLFWLAAAASFAAAPLCKAGQYDFTQITSCDSFLASQAFAWLSFLLWIGSLIISIVDHRNGEGIAGGKQWSAC